MFSPKKGTTGDCLQPQALWGSEEPKPGCLPEGMTLPPLVHMSMYMATLFETNGHRGGGGVIQLAEPTRGAQHRRPVTRRPGCGAGGRVITPSTPLNRMPPSATLP